MHIKLRDREALHKRYTEAKPYPFARIDGLLDPAFAESVAAAYPSLETARESGRTFKTVNERRKVQITDRELFPEPVAQLNQALASPEFLLDLSYITGIPNLLADEELVGGGIHVTGPGGRLDVHVDFNYMEQHGTIAASILGCILESDLGGAVGWPDPIMGQGRPEMRASVLARAEPLRHLRDQRNQFPWRYASQ